MSDIPDEAWEAIARELPATALPKLLRPHLAAYINHYAAGDYPASYMAEREALKAQNRTVADAARALIQSYDVRMAWRPGMNWSTDWDKHDAFLAQLREIAEFAESNLKKLNRRAPVSTRPRDIFLCMALELWSQNGGPITTTTRVDTGEADGRLVRYLIAVAAAAGLPLTANQARQFIRKARKVKHPAENK